MSSAASAHRPMSVCVCVLITDPTPTPASLPITPIASSVSSAALTAHRGGVITGPAPHPCLSPQSPPPPPPPIKKQRKKFCGIGRNTFWGLLVKKIQRCFCEVSRRRNKNQDVSQSSCHEQVCAILAAVKFHCGIHDH